MIKRKYKPNLEADESPCFATILGGDDDEDVVVVMVAVVVLAGLGR